MILNYKDFKSYSLRLNESIIFYIEEFKQVLNKISDNEIAADLINLERTDVDQDITFISLSDKLGYLDFSTVDNVKKNLSEYPKYNVDEIIKIIDTGEYGGPDIRNPDFFVYAVISQIFQLIGDKSRNSIKLGKFINKLFPGKYNSKQIEEFTNKFKATIEDNEEKFELVEGEDIRKWYLENNHFLNEGTLGSSCMRYKECQDYFDIYVKNPSVCKLLILKKEGKLLGRALVWKLSELNGEKVDRWYMDRQYAIYQHDFEKFKNYAKEKGWIIRKHNNHFSTTLFVDGDKESRGLFRVKLDKYEFDTYPYMDTFKRLNLMHGTLHNDESDEYDGCLILAQTNGGYVDTTNRFHWSEWFEEDIPEDEAVWSDIVDSWIWNDRKVYISYGSHRGDYAPDDYEDLILLEYKRGGGYAHINDCVYNEYYETWYYYDDTVRCHTEIDKNGYVRNPDNFLSEEDDYVLIDDLEGLAWFDYLSNIWLVDVYGIHKDTLIKNYNDVWIPRSLAIKTYQVTDASSSNPENLGGIKWLTIADAISLGWNVKTSGNGRTVDMISYNEDIKNLIPKIKKRINGAIKAYRELDQFKGQQRLYDRGEINYTYLRSLEDRKAYLDNELFLPKPKIKGNLKFK